MFSLLKVIQHSEDQALSLGDLRTAMRLNWLRNALDSGLELDKAFEQYLKATITGSYVVTAK